jgi:hypothetical protein
MSYTQTKTTNPTKPETTRPTYTAYHVSEPKEEGGKGRWTELGAFFSHKDGNGGTLILDALPIHFDGRILLRAPSPNVSPTSCRRTFSGSDPPATRCSTAIAPT